MLLGIEKNRKRSIRSLWISRINAAVRDNNISYSQFINQLKQKDIIINRKVLSNIAIEDPKAFKK